MIASIARPLNVDPTVFCGMLLLSLTLTHKLPVDLRPPLGGLNALAGRYMLARYGIHCAHHQDGISSHAERKLLEQAPLLKFRAYKIIRPTRR